MRLLCLIFWAVTAVGLANAEQPKSEAFDLKIRLVDPFNGDFAVLTTVHAEQPFELTATNGKMVNKFSGILHAPRRGTYPLDLTISEWRSPKSNFRDTMKLKIEPGKTCAEASIDGLVYEYNVVLRTHKSDP